VLAAGSIFDPLYKAVGWLLAVLYLPLHSLGLAIIVMTVLVMAVQLPLIAKQTRSMIMMQRIQPEIKKLQQKYKDDRQKQNEELLKLYQEYKINPLAGCLPMIPILFIGIAVLGTFRRGGLPAHVPQTGQFDQLYHAMCGNQMVAHKCNSAISAASKAGHPPAVLRFLGLDLNLSAADAVHLGAVSALPYLILIALVVGTGWYQVAQTQRRQSASGASSPVNAQMQAITKIFPIFFGILTYTFNAATTLYFVVSNIWRIGQQHFVLNKMYEEEHQRGADKSNPKAEVVEDDPPPPAKPPPKLASGGPTKRSNPGNPNGAGNPSPNAARRKRKKRKR